MRVPSGAMVDISGAFEDMSESFMDIGPLMVISLVLVSPGDGIACFESLKMPESSSCSPYPSAFAGVAIALFLTAFANLSLIDRHLARIMLIGMVVKNAIVLVDFISTDA
ncbi:MAG: hypothetical protein MZU84_01165 [Sphingobacterium sp.]|nr:hypothetical protein [Sphingobacterium sp.]